MKPGLPTKRLTLGRSNLLLQLMVLSPLAFAQSGGPAASSDEDPINVVEPEEQAIDEITVVAPRSISAIKAEIARADRKMYGLFNEMNDDRRYDVFCRLEKRHASNMKRRVCLPQFENELLEEAYESTGTWTSFDRPEAELRRHREVLRQKMIDFAAQNPELQQAIYERAQLQRDLTEAEDRQREARREE